MADVTITPNMNLPVPTDEDIGPDYVTNNTACFNAVDSHNHSTGQGVQITPDGLDINVDLPLNGNNLTTAKSVNFTAQGSPLAGAADIGCIYVSGKDLYYNDEDGNQVRITTGGNVNAGAGSITGLPSGTASVSFAAATYTFQSATNTPASMAVGPLIVGAAAASPKTVTMGPSVSQPANYAITFPLALPASTSIRNCDSSGQEGYVAPDNSTFGISGGVYQVLNSGVTNAKLAPLNYSSTSRVTTTVSTSTYALTGLSAVITTVGRPVIIMLLPALDATQQSFISSTPGGRLSLEVQRNGTVVGQSFLTVISGGDPQQINFTWYDDGGSAGVNTYTLLGKRTGGDIDLNYSRFVAIEL
jgi:hypothetical protein